MRTEVFHDIEELTSAAADRFRRRAAEATGARGRFSVALAGGRTPRGLYERLSRAPYRREIPWPETVLAVGDERPVPQDHADSNYGMIRRALLDRLPAAPRAVCRFAAEAADPAAAAADYEADLRGALEVDPGQIPRFDLVLLGLGGDAHTASLFPESPALEEKERLALVVPGPGGAHRFTLTPPVLNSAAEVVFIVAGSGKAAAVRDVLNADPDPVLRPAQVVRPSDGMVVWMLDRLAARLL